VTTRSLRPLLAVAIVVALSGGPVVAAETPRAAPATVPTAATVTTTAAKPTLAQLIGQKLVVRMDGATPSADLLGRIERGEVGGIILFGSNVTTPAALVELTTTLHAAAAAGGQPPLLIAVDQEGGKIKRIPWAPPTLSAPQMGRLQLASIAREQGASTGAALHDLGIDLDLAPVADVPVSSDSFMFEARRTFSFNPTRTANLANSFALGLKSAGVLSAMKHFPGTGYATLNTDAHAVTIRASRTELGPGLRPYRMAIANGVPLIMLSNATYPAYDARNGAGWSYKIGVNLLRRELGFAGVTITDSLDGTAKARGLWPRVLAVSTARAGTDMILTTGSEASTAAMYATLLRRARDGSIPLSTLQASYKRILALKAGL
jgi:beta-N-acetylhexosaminidase